MKIFKQPEIFLLLFITVSSLGCRSHYGLTSANRDKYVINDQLPVDSAIVQKYMPYKQQVEAQMSSVIGQSARELTKPDNQPETLLANFFSDAVLSEGKKIDPSIQFTVPSTKGGLRTSLPAGDIRLSNIFELMPFENEMVVLKVKGSDVEQLLNFIAQTGGQPVAGIRMKIVSQKPVEVLIDGQPFDKEKTYTILTSDYLAGGGDNTLGMKNPLEKKVLGLKLRDALINYIKTSTASGKIIDAQLDGRITNH